MDLERVLGNYEWWANNGWDGIDGMEMDGCRLSGRLQLEVPVDV